MNKHTAGPFRAVLTSVMSVREDKRKETIVARCNLPRRRTEEALANARLFAAADALLAACRAQQKLIQEILDAYELCAIDFDYWDFDPDEYQQALNSASAAIAKAEGDDD